MALHDTADDLVPVESLVRGLGVIINMLAVLANLALSLVLTLLIGSGSPNRAAFLDNRAMCQLVGIALQALAVASALTLLVIAMSNFWIIVLEKQHLTRRQIHTAIAGIWAVTLGYSCLPLAVPGGGFIKQPSTFHCALDPVSDHPAAVIVRTLNMAVLILTPSLIGLFYALIARKLWLTLRHSELGSVSIAATGEHVSSFGSNVATKSSNKGTYSSSSAATFDADHTDTVDAGNATAQAHGQRTGPATMARGPSTMKSLANHNEQQIRTVALQIAVIIYQVAIHAPASPLTEALVFVQLSSNALLNPILLVLMDGRYREAVGSMIGRRAAHVGPQPPSKGG
ncbi:hypothetical protein BC831DRAFT_448081 [Entophlyctis helioformis]|nr:hypothetical protein BC831DRAFT_448081 [Entophlyctis helioformis]